MMRFEKAHPSAASQICSDPTVVHLAKVPPVELAVERQGHD
jgi:hypothetical protein